jgi:mannose-6-phosphate isomerase-like protein (cupin superfamily)
MSKSAPVDQLWFQDQLATIRVPMSEGQDGISIIEYRAPYGFSPPLHLHRTADEVFHVLEGELRVKVKDQEHRLGPGDILLGPKGVPHTFRVESEPGSRYFTIAVGGDFERFLRAVSRPAERPELPEPAGPPSADAIQTMRAAAAKYGTEVVGPPLQ